MFFEASQLTPAMADGARERNYVRMQSNLQPAVRLRSGRMIIMPYVVYILECSDGSYYTGSAADLSRRLWEHETGASSAAYTFSRRPVKLVWTSEEVARYSDTLRFERQVKGWSRAKKEALIRGSYEAVHEVVKQERQQREKRKKASSR